MKIKKEFLVVGFILSLIVLSAIYCVPKILDEDYQKKQLDSLKRENLLLQNELLKKQLHEK